MGLATTDYATATVADAIPPIPRHASLAIDPNVAAAGLMTFHYAETDSDEAGAWVVSMVRVGPAGDDGEAEEEHFAVLKTDVTEVATRVCAALNAAMMTGRWEILMSIDEPEDEEPSAAWLEAHDRFVLASMTLYHSNEMHRRALMDEGCGDPNCVACAERRRGGRSFAAEPAVVRRPAQRTLH